MKVVKKLCNKKDVNENPPTITSVSGEDRSELVMLDENGEETEKKDYRSDSAIKIKEEDQSSPTDENEVKEAPVSQISLNKKRTSKTTATKNNTLGAFEEFMKQGELVGKLGDEAANALKLNFEKVLDLPEVAHVLCSHSEDLSDLDAIKDLDEEAKEALVRAEKEKTMQAFKTLYLHPWYSKNVYNELSITNLTLCYERAKDDLSEINRLYGITPQNR